MTGIPEINDDGCRDNSKPQIEARRVSSSSGANYPYRFQIFKSCPARIDRLEGTAYRYWSEFALAWVLQSRLSQLQRPLNILDMGGRDGCAVRLFSSLGLSGRYTCVDLNPLPRADLLTRGFVVEYVRGSLFEYRPHEPVDIALFEGSLEFVTEVSQISWIADALSPSGFVLATLMTPFSESFYRGFVATGAHGTADASELATRFEPSHLELETALPLVGVSGWLMQGVLQRTLVLAIGRRLERLAEEHLGKKGWNPVSLACRLANSATAKLDRLCAARPLGHCIVLKRRLEKLQPMS